MSRLSKSGTITLFAKGDIEIVTRSYRTIKDRDAIVAHWKRLYGKVFLTMAYQISPNLTKYDAEIEMEQIIELKGMGLTNEAIGRKLGLHKETIRQRLLKYGVKAA